ncbi:hypothetical protein BGZ47_004278 [Haplosporangium gracile]|nr:hypothetical protein BGZ47_004278 [Haplosporangium gracile]
MVFAGGEGGNAQAENKIGLMYHQGQGSLKITDLPFCGVSKRLAEVMQSPSTMSGSTTMTARESTKVIRKPKALDRYIMAANQGHAPSQVWVGYICETGLGDSQDFRAAMAWSMYHWGNGVPQDPRKAMEWYIKAANQGNAQARRNMDILYQHDYRH